MTPPDDYTLGEVWRRVDSLERQLHEGISLLRQDVAKLQFVSVDTHKSDLRLRDERIDQLQNEIRDMKGANTWRTRTLVAAAISLTVAVIVLAIQLLVGGVQP